MNIFESRESAVRSYCRRWPVVFDRARGAHLYDEHGRGYLDFFAGAGALNYGHNPPELVAPLVEYLQSDRVVHSLDMHTVAKREFLETLDELVLSRRGHDYRVQFPGPGGANAVEAALKLARKVTGRTEVLCFTNGFHGMTLGALSVTGDGSARRSAGLPLTHATPLPYDGALDGPDFSWLDRLLGDSGSGLDLPAAAIVETVQAEGGIHVARTEWLRGLAARCRAYGVLLIVDDVQMGCGRTGPLLSFEAAGIEPDLVCLSKSISGMGNPLALTLIRPDLDQWAPGEHSGTFRGFDPAFVTGTAALRRWWSDSRLEDQTTARAAVVSRRLSTLAASLPTPVSVRGRGLVWGLAFEQPDLAAKTAAAAFDRGLLVETAGPASEVLKLLPPLTVTDDELDLGLDLLADAATSVC